MVVENVSETLKRELPALLRADPDLRRYVLELTRGGSMRIDNRRKDRCDRILDELRQDREAQECKGEEQDRKWWQAQTGGARL